MYTKISRTEPKWWIWWE